MAAFSAFTVGFKTVANSAGAGIRRAVPATRTSSEPAGTPTQRLVRSLHSWSAFPLESRSAAALNLHAGKIRLGVFRDLDRVDVGEDIGGNVVWHVMRQRSERLDFVGALDRDA